MSWQPIRGFAKRQGRATLDERLRPPRINLPPNAFSSIS
jgi:hypothetical protein